MSYQTYEPELYDLENSNEWLRALENDGYVVIRDIIGEKVRRKARKLFKSDMKFASKKINWKDPMTLNVDNLPIVYNRGSAIFNGFGHSKIMWYLRIQPSIQKAFSHIYSTDDLAVSFEGFNIILSDKQQTKKWLHQEQHQNTDRLSIQGMINLFNTGVNDAGFVVVPGSHKTCKPPVPLSKRDWVLLRDDDPLYQEAVKLIIPKNCLVLWNSKTVHASTNMTPNDVCTTIPKINQLSAYITFYPRKNQSEKIKQLRIEGYISGETTSHWVNRHEVKHLPFFLRNEYNEKGFRHIKGHLEKDGSIPLCVEKLI